MRVLAIILCRAAATAVIAALAVAPADAQSAPPGVAYVSALDGNVTVMRGDNGDFEAAAVNAPLTAGDYLSTEAGARSEVSFDAGHVLRVGPQTQVRLTEISETSETVQLADGTVALGVIRATNDIARIETPSVTVQPQQNGFYRVAVNADGSTAITVRSGSAAILLPQGTQNLTPGNTMMVWGAPNAPSYRFVNAPAVDAFDQWNTDRDGMLADANAYQYAAPWMPGLAELNGYGTWSNDPSYGNVWAPTVAAGWTPYSSGQWRWVPYYGWTWVDSASWGYAPSHYGRWFYDQRFARWAWAPGGVSAPVQPWAPAVVSFFGYGAGGGTGFGWVPLAPHETFRPWWGNNATQANNYVNVRTTYANARWPGAARGLPGNAFASGAYRHTMSLSQDAIARVPVVHSVAMLPNVPAAHSFRYAQRSFVPAHPPQPAAFHTLPNAPASAAPRAPFAAPHAAVQPQYQRPALEHPSTVEGHPQFVPPSRPPAQVQPNPPQQFAAPHQQPVPVRTMVRPDPVRPPEAVHPPAPAVHAVHPVAAPPVRVAPQQAPRPSPPHDRPHPEHHDR